MTPSRPTTGAGELLSIDVPAELCKVSGLALEGPWQIPSALVRWAGGLGARRAEVRLRRRHWRIWTDALLDPRDLTLIGIVLDARRPDNERHEAFVALEQSDAREFACLSSCKRGTLRVWRGDPAASHGISWRLGFANTGQPSTPDATGTTIDLRGSLSGRARAADWVRDVARFAEIEVTVDGAPIERGFRGSLGRRALAAPLEGRASLSTGDDGARVWLLHRGATVAHLTVPEAPAAEVALELGGTGRDPSPAALREAALSLKEDLVEQIVELLVASGRQLFSLPAAHQVALRRQLLRASVFRRARTQISQLRIIPALVGPARERRLLQLAELEKTAAANGSLGFISPGDSTTGLVAGSAPLVVLDGVERARLARRTGIRLAPPPRQAPLPLLERFRRRLARFGRSVRARLNERRPATTDSLDRAAVSRIEEAFRAATPCHDGPAIHSVRFVRGRGPASVSGGRVDLPAGDPLVAKSLTLLGRDRRFQAAVVLALGQGELFAPAVAKARHPGTA